MNEVDLSSVLDWAAAEGWNPGLDDAAAFFAADPRGFFIKEIAGRPVTAVSVVNHDTNFAFLGLYLCLPEFRGRGFGLETWQAALAHAGARCVGLDGVPDQQANYARSGFARFGRTVRYQGCWQAGSDASAATPSLSAMMDADCKATGHQRSAFTSAWFEPTASRRTVGISSGGADFGFATFRKCREGVKIGPFHAHTAQQVCDLLSAMPPEFGNGPLFIDVPESSDPLMRFLARHGFEPVFETARMYSAAPPAAAQPQFYGIATMELG